MTCVPCVCCCRSVPWVSRFPWGCNFQISGSMVQTPKLQVPSSKFQAPGSRLQLPGSRFHARGSKSQAPGSRPEFWVQGSRLPNLKPLICLRVLHATAMPWQLHGEAPATPRQRTRNTLENPGRTARPQLQTSTTRTLRSSLFSKTEDFWWIWLVDLIRASSDGSLQCLQG